MKEGIGSRPRAVYTALIGNYDQLSPITFRSSIRFVVFTDNSDLSARGWEKRDIADLSGMPRDMPSWMVNRYLKMHPHVFLPEFEETLYVDSNIRLLRDPAPLFDINLSNGVIAIPYHMERNDIRDELNACLRTGKVGNDDYKSMLLRLRFYEAQSMPRRPMTENNVIFRRDSPAVRSAMNVWWDEIRQGITRDQIALPYALHKTELDVVPVRDGPRTSKRFMTIRPHWPVGKRKNLRYYARLISGLRHRSGAYMLAAKAVDALLAVKKRALRS
jgi:hypothetical protein